MGDARLEDPRWRRPRLDHQLFESFLFGLVEASVFVELEMTKVRALHCDRAAAVEVYVDLGVCDAARFELRMRRSVAWLEDWGGLLRGDAPDTTVVLNE